VRKLFVVLLLAWLATDAGAETRYVTDQFKITLRSGESTGHSILKMLPSGSALELLGTNADTGYSQVRTADGKTGFVLTRQLMHEPSARDRLARAEKRLHELQDEPGRLSARLASLQDEHQKLTDAFAQLQKAKGNLEQELVSIRRTSANAVRIAEERDQLRQSLATMTREIEEVKQQNLDLTNDSTQRWFLIGAGVLVAGIILGLILPHLRFQRRKSSWGTL